MRTPHPPEVRDRAVEMRAAGATYQQIAADLGASTGTVYRWCNPSSAVRQRDASLAWKHAHRRQRREYDYQYGRRRAGTCLQCGGRMGAQVTHDGVCAECRSATRAARCHQIQDMWLAGQRLVDIASAIGKSQGWTAAEMGRMRNQGWDLPRRKPFSGAWVEAVAA